MFKNKILLISGGTGSFGSTVLRRFLTTDIKEIFNTVLPNEPVPPEINKILLISGGTGSFGSTVLKISLISVVRNLLNTVLPNEPVPPEINKILFLNIRPSY